MKTPILVSAIDRFLNRLASSGTTDHNEYNVHGRKHGPWFEPSVDVLAAENDAFLEAENAKLASAMLSPRPTLAERWAAEGPKLTSAMRRAAIGSDLLVAEGDYIDGKRHGHWILWFVDGQVEEGSMADDKQNGHWVLRNANGDVQEGPYVDNEKHGIWVVRFAGGDVAEGPYVNGKRQGNWIVRLANGDVHEGPMVDDKAHGLWVTRLADGSVDKICYENGNEVDC